MIWWRPAIEYRGNLKPWWATRRAQAYGAGGIAKTIIAGFLGGIIFENAANDRDRLRW